MGEAPNYDSKDVINNPPEMWMSEIAYLKKKLMELSENTKVLEILEWGSGNGTIFFSSFLKEKGIDFHWTAIEHFLPWHEKVKQMLKDKGLDDRVEVLLKSPTMQEDKLLQEKEDLSEYIHYPKRIGKNFDFILVDGRRRAECLLSASSIVSTKGVVALHDAERVWYYSGFEPYINRGEFINEISSPNACGGVQKLWIGKITDNE